ncbi:hypothetical protein D881_05475 [Corynebacterium ulcerans NCTC 12077]|nr:hypothetical protein D881_05475 [Corynebacterium ulcerans NCTC 12077]
MALNPASILHFHRQSPHTVRQKGLLSMEMQVRGVEDGLQKVVCQKQE